MKALLATAITLMLAVRGASSQTELPSAFTDGMTRTKIEFAMPAGFTPSTIAENPHMNYEYAMQCDTSDIEIRYATRPLDKLIDSYKKSLADSTRKMVNPDQPSSYVTIDAAVTYNISDKIISKVSLGKEFAQRCFNADGGSLTWSTPRKEFGLDHKLCMTLCTYKYGIGLAFIFFLGDDADVISQLAAREDVSRSFRFVEESAEQQMG